MNPFAEIAPSAASITDYDRQHFLTYARLLDEARHGIAWHRTVAKTLMPTADWMIARRCYLSHLERARYLYRDVGNDDDRASTVSH